MWLKRVLGVVFFVATPLAAQEALPEIAPLWDSAYVFYDTQDNHPVGRCTTNPFYADAKGSYFLTAAHCLRKSPFLVAKLGVPPKPLELVVFDLDLDIGILLLKGEQLPILALGSDPKIGEQVATVGFPFMKFRALITGVIASPPEPEAPFQVAIDGRSGMGMSGAAVYCLEQKAVCGMLVGHFDQSPDFSVMVPISNLRKMAWEAAR